MRLIIREYLGMLRESRELDLIFPDLLLSMNIIPITRPQIGVRQAGVDIAAVGPDDNGIQTLWLFVVKVGDLGRQDWHGGPQSVRSSLDEIKDVYLRSHVNKEHSEYPVTIVVTTTGELKQDTDSNWAGYTHDNTINDQRNYELWNGDQLAILIESHLLNEFSLPEPQRADLRRALALVGESEYQLEHFYKLLTAIFNTAALESKTKDTQRKAALRSLRTATIALGILCNWADNEGNLRNGVHAAERTLLWAWEMVRILKVDNSEKIVRAYSNLIWIYLGIGATYFNKLQSHFHTREGISRYYAEAPLLNEQVFEQIGLIATIGASHYYWGIITNDAKFANAAKAIAESLHALIENHRCSGSPCYDGQITDITLAFILLHACQKEAFAKEWLRELISRLAYTYRTGHWFPISTDSFDDLVELESGQYDDDIAKLMETSWLVPTLAQWAAVLNEDEAYDILVGLQKDTLKETCLQIWYPDDQTDEYLFKGQAQYESGITDAPMSLPVSAKDMCVYIRQSREDSPIKEPFHSSAQKAGIPFLDFIANRHFRIPVDPAYWQNLCLNQPSAENKADEIEN